MLAKNNSLNDKIKDYIPSQEEGFLVFILEDLANLLVQLMQFIKILSSQKYPSLSFLFPMYYALVGGRIARVKVISKEVETF